MIKSLLTLLFSTLILSFTIGDENCTCNKEKLTQSVLELKFESEFLPGSLDLHTEFFKDLTVEQNKQLWYDEIQYPRKTIFTWMWDDYAPNNYHASQSDFIEYFKDKNEVELAFQFGPNEDLWAYHTFTFKKIDSCYIGTRTYFRHARFTNKSYSILCQYEMESLYETLKELPIKEVNQYSDGGFRYTGFFQNNRDNRTFQVEFDNEREEKSSDTTFTKLPDGKIDTAITRTTEYKKSILNLFRLVDNEIEWIESYNVSKEKN